MKNPEFEYLLCFSGDFTVLQVLLSSEKVFSSGSPGRGDVFICSVSISVCLMEQEFEDRQLREEIAKVKDLHERKFNYLTDNFYVMRSALRYFSVRQGLSFDASRVADNFPVVVSVAGSCLNVLSELGVLEPRTDSTSPDLYLPRSVDMERLDDIRRILLEEYEIEEF